MLKRNGLLLVAIAANIGLSACQQKLADTAASPATSAAAAELASGSPTGGKCGTIAGLVCASKSDFCKTEINQCDVADVQGTCSTRPEVCTKEFIPVCGCDGKTYGNACEAAAAGVNVSALSECKAPKG